MTDLNSNKRTSKSLIPRYKKGDKIKLSKPKVRVYQKSPSEPKNNLTTPRHVEVPRLLTTKEEEEISNSSKINLMSVTVSSVISLASGMPIPKSYAEATLLYLG